MGYSEVLCTICGVSFNIGRIRTAKEPRSAAWSLFGPILGDVEPAVGCTPDFVDGARNSWIGECHRDAGCMFTMRKIKDECRKITIDERGKRKLVPREQAIAEEEEDDDDEEWVEQYEEHDEPLEYYSDVEEQEEDADNKAAGTDIEMEDVGRREAGTSQKESIRSFWRLALTKDQVQRKTLVKADSSELPAWNHGIPDYLPPLRWADVKDTMFPLFYPGRDGASEYGTDDSFDENQSVNKTDRDSAKNDHYLTGKLGYCCVDEYDVEHIAGPGCLNQGGYSGHEIAVKEMRGCQISQCLVRKLKDRIFEPLEDDEEFEKQVAFFLSGLSDHMPSRDSSSPIVRPPRHGCPQPHAENFQWNIEETEEYALPFHPSCFEVYKRASLVAKGVVDVAGLTSWWTEEGKEYSDYAKQPCDPNVKKCNGQEWQHLRGTSYLVANPLFVPKLQDIFQAVTSTAPEFSPRNGTFPVAKFTPLESHSDPFALLPIELRFEILDSLGSKDIAALRLSTRAFRELPISYFQKLIKREMPWVWEAWPTTTNANQPRYALWATMPPAAAQAKLQKGAKSVAVLKDYVKIVTTEMPELKAILGEILPVEIQAALNAHRLELEEVEDRKPFFLPPQGTNYFELYTLITRHWADLKGLQNRRRIWTGCEEILRMIEVGRKEGRFE